MKHYSLIPKNSRLRHKTSGYSFFYYICLFLSLSMLGWLWEVTLCLFTEHVFANRGILFGPWLPIYGAGGLFLYFLLYRLKSHPIRIFLLADAICLSLEYFCSWFMEQKWGVRWWDYSNRFGNLNGRICLAGALIFGVGALAVIYVLIPLFERLYERIPSPARKAIGLALLLLFLADAAYAAAKPNMGNGITTRTLSYTTINNKKASLFSSPLDFLPTSVILFVKHENSTHCEKESTHKRTAQRVPPAEKGPGRLCGRWLWSGIAELAGQKQPDRQ